MADPNPQLKTLRDKIVWYTLSAMAWCLMKVLDLFGVKHD